MKETFRLSMAWLHAWSGLLTCWVLFLVFASGTASYFRDEITLWMEPELHAAAAMPVSSAQAAQSAVAFLQKEAAGASRWFITLPDARHVETNAIGRESCRERVGQEGSNRVVCGT